MGDPGEPAAVPVEDGPLSSRIESKSWKTRAEAFEELAKLFDSSAEDSEAFDEYANSLAKLLKDSNVNAQEKAIEAASSFARRGPLPTVAKVASAIMALAVEKAFGQAKCKVKAQDLALLLIEAEAGEAVAEELIKGCAHKQPKIAGAAAESLRAAIEGFGLKPLGAQGKQIVKLSVTMFDSTNAAVRGEAKPIAVELYKYMGTALRPSYENLRPAQQKDIDEAFAEAGKPVPTRKTRTAAAKLAAAAKAASEAPPAADGAPAPAAAAIEEEEVLDLFEPVSVLDKLPKDWCDAVIAAAKWQEKVEKIEVLVDLAKAPKLASGDYHEVVKTLKKLMGDSMVVVVATSVSALGNLAKGLGKEFSSMCRGSMAVLLDRLKEKDKRVVNTIHSTLDNYFSKCITLADVADDITLALGPKGAAKAKLEVLKVIKRVVDAKPSAVNPKAFMPVVQAVAKTCDDATPDIREGAYAGLAAFLNAVGPAAMAKVMEGMDDKKRKKVESMAGPSTNAAAAPAPAVKKIVKKAAPAADAAEEPPAAPAPAAKPAAAAAKPAAAAAPLSAVRKSTVAKPAVEKKEGGAEESEKAGVPVEQLDELVEQWVAADIREKLASANWKERLEAAEALESMARDGGQAMEHPVPEALARLMAKTVVDKKETNFQVSAKLFGAVQALAEKCPKFTKRATHWFVGSLVEKLGDVKLRTPASDCLLMLAEACTPQFVLSQAQDAIAKQKSPKTQENALLWVNALAVEFGCRMLKAKPLLDFVKGLLEVSNPGVKKAAIEVLSTMRSQIGPDVRNMLSDVKPALLTTIDEAFAKVAAEASAAAPVPTRQVKGGTEDAAAAVDEGGLVNLTSVVAPHLKSMGDANWKERQAGITAVDEAISKGKPLGAPGVYMEAQCGELWPALKARLKDSNKNLAIQVLNLLAKLAAACGPPAEKYAKTVMPNMLTLISDNKKTVRDAVVAAMQAWSEICSPETIIKYLPLAISVDSPAGREDAVRWGAAYLSTLKKSSQLDLSGVVAPVVECLEHRVAEVRGVAEKCLVAIIACSGPQQLHLVLRDMKPAQLKSLKPLCDKAERAAAAMAGEAPPPAQAEVAVASAPVASAGVAAVAKRVAKAEASAKVEPVAAVVVVAEVEEGALLKAVPGKEAREKKHNKIKWLIEDAKEVEGYLQGVAEMMQNATSPSLHANLFSKDFKKQVDGLKDLATFLPEHPDALMANTDLVLKMCSLRLMGKGSNPSVSLSVLELLRTTLEVLVSSDYRLSEVEAMVCLPCLMEEVGCNNDTQKKLIRELLKKATQVYPASKIFALLADTANSTRNQKSRAEALSEMAALTERLGLEQVCVPSKTIPVVGAFVAERDVGVRNAALDCLVAAYQTFGERVWKHLTKLEQKEKDMIDSRFKKSGKAAPPAAALSSSASRTQTPDTNALRKSTTCLQQQQQEEEAAAAPVPSALRASMPMLPMASHTHSVLMAEGNTPVRPSRSVINDLLDAPTPSINTIRSRFTGVPSAAPASDGMTAATAVKMLASGVNSEALAGFKHISGLVTAAGGPSERDVAQLKRDADAFTTAVRVTLAEHLSRCAEPEEYRLVKHGVYAAHTVFTACPVVCAAVGDAPLAKLVEELLVRLHDDQLPPSEEVDILMRGMNELVMDVLHSAKPNAVYTLLVRFLYEGAPLSGREASPEFIDGVLRCLLEMARCMQAYISKLDVDLLLYDAHMFLVAHPPSKYRGREFRPLRLLKTILNELVKLKGAAIRQHLTLVPVDTKPTLCSYLDLVLQQQASKAGSAPSKAGGESSAEDLTSIFDKIGSKDKEVAKEGFKLLYTYQRTHADFSLEGYLAGRSPQFQDHVHKNLAKVHAQAETASGPSCELLPLQNAMSNNNKSPPKNPLTASVGAGALLDKLQGIRTQLGIEGSQSQAPVAARDSPKVAAPVVVPAVGGGAEAASCSVMNLQERLARLKQN